MSWFDNYCIEAQRYYTNQDIDNDDHRTKAKNSPIIQLIKIIYITVFIIILLIIFNRIAGV